MTRLAIVAGNPKPNSRTLHVAETVAAEITHRHGTAIEQVVIDLSDFGSHMFDPFNEDLADVVRKVVTSQLLIVASPTFKATYTGLLKAFFDRFSNDALNGAAAVPVMVGATPEHALAPELFLRPLLVELGATVPTRSFFISEASLGRVEELVRSWAEVVYPLIARALESPTTVQS
jgi:FMN reductase